jgi:hypothetical protein
MIRSTPQGLINEGPSRCRPDERQPTLGAENATRIDTIPRQKRFKCRTRDCSHRVHTQDARCKDCIRASKRAARIAR